MQEFDPQSSPAPQPDFPPSQPIMPDAPGMPPMPPMPDATAPQPPAPKRRRGRNALLIALASLLAVILVAGGALYVVAQKPKATVPPTLANILQRAQDANLQDASFSIQMNQSANLGATSITTKLTGTGQMTSVPQRLHIMLNSDGGFGAGPTEVILDGGDVYIRVPDLGGVSNPFGDKPWIKISGLGDLGPSGLTGTGSLPVFAYQSLTDLKLVGAEKLNGKATWHIQGTVQNTAVTSTDFGSTSSTETEDAWLLQDTSFPAQITMHTTASLSSQTGGTTFSLASSSDETLTFTTWNTGLTITLPPPDQVSDGFPTPTPSPTPKPKHK